MFVGGCNFHFVLVHILSSWRTPTQKQRVSHLKWCTALSSHPSGMSSISSPTILCGVHPVLCAVCVLLSTSYISTAVHAYVHPVHLTCRNPTASHLSNRVFNVLHLVKKRGQGRSIRWYPLFFVPRTAQHRSRPWTATYPTGNFHTMKDGVVVVGGWGWYLCMSFADTPPRERIHFNVVATSAGIVMLKAADTAGMPNTAVHEAAACVDCMHRSQDRFLLPEPAFLWV